MENIKEQIIKEITSIMEAQEHLGAEKENYRHNETAVKMYVDILKVLKEDDFKEKEFELKKLMEKRLALEQEFKTLQFQKELDLKEREFKIESDRKERELELKALEEERLTKELELKEQQLKMEFENKLRQDIFDVVKAVGSAVAFTMILKMILTFEDKGVITTKAFGPFIGQAFRSLLPK